MQRLVLTFIALVTSTTCALAACGDDADDAASASSGSGAAGAATSSAGGDGSGASSSSSGEGGGGGGTGGISGDPIEAWCSAVGDPYCEAIYACCTSEPGTVEDCKAEWAAECIGNLTEDLAPVLAAGSSQLGAAKLSACVTKLGALSAGGAACVEPPRWVFFTECIAAFEGQVPAGGACITTPDDISFVECDHGLCQGGMCVPFLQEGEACTLGGSGFCDYLAGLWCNFDGTTASCAPRGDLGDACTPVDPGDPAIDCKSLACGADGMCAPPTAEGLCSDPS